jgi:hypothetical protein
MLHFIYTVGKYCIEISIFMPPHPFKEEGVYCFANVGLSVRR